jgi:hypothetical protein
MSFVVQCVDIKTSKVKKIVKYVFGEIIVLCWSTQFCNI